MHHFSLCDGEPPREMTLRPRAARSLLTQDTALLPVPSAP